MKVNYSQKNTPDKYRCEECGASEVKLWREYGVSNPRLLCCICAGRISKRDISNIDNKGRIIFRSYKTDTIGWFVPAIPDEEGTGYWGYSSVPDDGIVWWEGLSTKPEIEGV